MSYRSRLAAIVLTLAALPSPADAVAIRVPPPAGSSEAGFGLDAYAQLSATDGNLAFSPASIFLALALLEKGADTQDAAQMQQAMHLARRGGDVAIGDLDTQLRAFSSLDLGNGVWVARGDKLKRDYARGVMKSLHAELASLDFKRHPERSRRAINKWIAKHTGGKIKQLLPAGSVDSSTEIVLASAVHFLGAWADAFDAKDTRDGDFTLGDGTQATVSMMHRTGPARLASDQDASMLEMPYAGSTLAMDVIVPADGVALHDLETTIASRYAGWVSDLGASEDVAIALPRWHADVHTDLPTLLRGLGLGFLFDGFGLDGMLGKTATYSVSGAFHQTVVDVTEKGTEASAATGITIEPTMMRQTPSFAADRPFVWVIRDTQSGAILFMGRVADPR